MGETIIDATKVNKIEQNLKFEFGRNTVKAKEMLSNIKEWLVKNTKQKIDGDISDIDLCLDSYDLNIKISVMKEDRLKLIESKKEETVEKEAESETDKEIEEEAKLAE